MFWIIKTYNVPDDGENRSNRIEKFALENGYQYSHHTHTPTYRLKKPEKPQPANMFSLQVEIEKSTATVRLKPNNWFLGVMFILITMAILCVVDENMRQSGGISFPLLLAIPYVYHLYANKQLSELKACLIPDYEKTADGRKEVFAGYAKPLRLFLNFQRNAYILFVIVFIVFMLLWMFGVTDRFFPQP